MEITLFSLNNFAPEQSFGRAKLVWMKRPKMSVSTAYIYIIVMSQNHVISHPDETGHVCIDVRGKGEIKKSELTRKHMLCAPAAFCGEVIFCD